MKQEDGELYAGERVLWRGEPDRKVFVEPADWLVMAAGAGMTAVVFGLFLPNMFSTGGGSNAFLYVWAALFLVLVVGRMVGHPLVRAVVLASTEYTVTDRRVLVRTNVFGPRTVSDYYGNLRPPVCRERADHTGTVAFGELPSAVDTVLALNRRTSARRTPPPIVLRRIPQARHVHDIIVAARDRHRTAH